MPVKITEKIVNGEDINKGYTELSIKDLLNPELWTNSVNVLKLEKELSQIVSPFKTANNTFFLYAKVGQKDLNFSKISDEALTAAISKYTISLTRDKLLITGSYKMNFFDSKSERIDNIDYLQEFMQLKKIILKNVNLSIPTMGIL